MAPTTTTAEAALEGGESRDPLAELRGGGKRGRHSRMIGGLTRVLVADADGGSAQAMEKSLSGLGFVFGQVVKSVELVEEMRSFQPSLVLVSLDTWDVAGARRVVELARREIEFGHIPVAVTTSHPSGDQVLECMRAGVAEYFITPVWSETDGRGMARLVALARARGRLFDLSTGEAMLNVAERLQLSVELVVPSNRLLGSARFHAGRLVSAVAGTYIGAAAVARLAMHQRSALIRTDGEPLPEQHDGRPDKPPILINAPTMPLLPGGAKPTLAEVRARFIASLPVAPSPSASREGDAAVAAALTAPVPAAVEMPTAVVSRPLTAARPPSGGSARPPTPVKEHVRAVARREEVVPEEVAAKAREKEQELAKRARPKSRKAIRAAEKAAEKASQEAAAAALQLGNDPEKPRNLGWQKGVHGKEAAQRRESTHVGPVPTDPNSTPDGLVIPEAQSRMGRMEKGAALGPSAKVAAVASTVGVLGKLALEKVPASQARSGTPKVEVPPSRPPEPTRIEQTRIEAVPAELKSEAKPPVAPAAPPPAKVPAKGAEKAAEKAAEKSSEKEKKKGRSPEPTEAIALPGSAPRTNVDAIPLPGAVESTRIERVPLGKTSGKMAAAPRVAAPDPFANLQVPPRAERTQVGPAPGADPFGSLLNVPPPTPPRVERTQVGPAPQAPPEKEARERSSIDDLVVQRRPGTELPRTPAPTLAPVLLRQAKGTTNAESPLAALERMKEAERRGEVAPDPFAKLNLAPNPEPSGPQPALAGLLAVGAAAAAAVASAPATTELPAPTPPAEPEAPVPTFVGPSPLLQGEAMKEQAATALLEEEEPPREPSVPTFVGPSPLLEQERKLAAAAATVTTTALSEEQLLEIDSAHLQEVAPPQPARPKTMPPSPPLAAMLPGAVGPSRPLTRPPVPPAEAHGVEEVEEEAEEVDAAAAEEVIEDIPMPRPTPQLVERHESSVGDLLAEIGPAASRDAALRSDQSFTAEQFRELAGGKGAEESAVVSIPGEGNSRSLVDAEAVEPELLEAARAQAERDRLDAESVSRRKAEAARVEAESSGRPAGRITREFPNVGQGAIPTPARQVSPSGTRIPAYDPPPAALPSEARPGGKVTAEFQRIPAKGEAGKITGEFEKVGEPQPEVVSFASRPIADLPKPPTAEFQQAEEPSEKKPTTAEFQQVEESPAAEKKPTTAEFQQVEEDEPAPPSASARTFVGPSPFFEPPAEAAPASAKVTEQLPAVAAAEPRPMTPLAMPVAERPVSEPGRRRSFTDMFGSPVAKPASAEEEARASEPQPLPEGIGGPRASSSRATDRFGAIQLPDSPSATLPHEEGSGRPRTDRFGAFDGPPPESQQPAPMPLQLMAEAPQPPQPIRLESRQGGPQTHSLPAELPLDRLSPAPGYRAAPAPQAQRAAGQLDVPEPVSDARGERCLLVDGDWERTQALKAELERRGFDVATVGNGQAALPMLGVLRPSVLVAALDVPVLDGWGLAARMRADQRLCDVPVLLHAEETDAALASALERIGVAAPRRRTSPSVIAEEALQALAPRRDVLGKLAMGEPFHTRLELLGGRWLLLTLHAAGATGRVQWRSDERQGELFLEAGALQFASCKGGPEGKQEGQAALVRLLRTPSGTCRLEPDAVSLGTPLQEPLLRLLEKATQEADAELAAERSRHLESLDAPKWDAEALRWFERLAPPDRREGLAALTSAPRPQATGDAAQRELLEELLRRRLA